MQRKLEESHRNNCLRLANLLEMAFTWEETPEGYDHWENVATRFREMYGHGTNDGKPWVEPEPPLTDEDACVWPRLLVMVRDNDTEQWEGPFRYVGRYDDNKTFPLIVYRKDGLASAWKHARRATPAEIEAAK